MIKSTNNKALLIYSGYNERAVISFIRFIDNFSINYGIVASSPADSIFSTLYAEKVFFTRNSKDLNIYEFKDIIRTAYSKLDVNSVVIAPSTEGLNRWLIENRANIEDFGNVEIPLVSKDIYTLLSDKFSFSQLVRSRGLTVPREISIAEASENFVAKPRQYVSSRGKSDTPILINSESDKEKFLKIFNPEDFYYQEYVVGPSYYLLYYCANNGDIFSYSQENLVQQSGGKSILCAVGSTIHNDSVSTDYISLLKEVGYRGFIMIELKEQGGKYYMIEANPRFWGPFELVRKNSPDLFLAFLHDHGFDIQFDSYEMEIGAKYFWYGGYMDEILKNNPLTFYNYTESELHSAIEDWLLHDVYNRDDTKLIFNK